MTCFVQALCGKVVALLKHGGRLGRYNVQRAYTTAVSDVCVFFACDVSDPILI